MFANERDCDRAVRMLAGIPLVYAGSGGFVSGVLAGVLVVAGVLAFLTGLTGWCPLYCVWHLVTKR